MVAWGWEWGLALNGHGGILLGLRKCSKSEIYLQHSIKDHYIETLEVDEFWIYKVYLNEVVKKRATIF